MTHQTFIPPATPVTTLNPGLSTPLMDYGLKSLLRYSISAFSKYLHFRRRTLKNRGYAASCRIKRLEQKDELESEKGKEFEDLDKMQVELQVTAFRY